MRGLSRWRRTALILGVCSASYGIRYAVARATDSVGLRLAVNVVFIVLIGWMALTFFRVLLKESEEHVKKNPRPW